MTTKSISGSSVVSDCTISSRQDGSHNAYNNQYKSSNNRINCADFFNLPGSTKVTISGTARCINGTNAADANKSYTTTVDRLNIKNVAVNGGDSWYYFNSPSYIAVEYRYSDDYDIVEFYKTVTFTFTDANSSNTVTFNCEDLAINGNSDYINPNDSYDKRKSTPVFIPGEVYNFFIHFVDKYGHCTNGYRINNNTVWTADGMSEEICPIPFRYQSNTYYAAVPVKQNVLSGNSINTTNLRIYRSASSNKLTSEITDAHVKEVFVESFRSFTDYEKYSNLKWFQVTSGYNLNGFLPYYNNNEDKLFRFPLRSIASHNATGFNISVNGVTLPEGYVGFFISYEKFEPIKRITGMLTRNDFRSQDCITPKDGSKIMQRTSNASKSDLMFFYSGQYDISDSIRLDYNIMRIDGTNVWDTEDIPQFDYIQRCNNYKFCHDMNKPQVNYDLNTCPSVYAPPEYKLSIADSAADSRMGLGTALQLKDSYSLFPVYEADNNNNNKIKLYKVTFLNASRDIYMSNSKTLIRCSNIIYGTYCSTADVFPNGYLTYDGCIIYENAGMNFNTANNIVYRTRYNDKYYPSETNQHTYEVNIPFLAYVQTPCFDDHFYESKCFKNEPTGYAFYVKQDTANLDKANENNKFQMGCIVTPSNSIDLFENRHSSADTFYTKSFTNYREDLVSVETYDKTVRRSSVIQDETRINGWRNFPVESYKNISENKGVITNLVGIGTVLLVHTEHSLFMFNTDNTLETKDKNIQLSQPDAFDVKYQEVFTSSLGYGGLQDDESFVVDQFGYIFYNNDFHRFYNFDNGQLNVIDEDIIQWLDKYKPYNVRFANDKFNNRLLVKMNYKVGGEVKDAIISYNYNVNHFVSLHSYHFDKAYNTKSQLYLKCEDEYHTDCSLHQFVQDGSSYGYCDNIKGNLRSTSTVPAKIGIIINEQYDDVKFLESISYKLNKFVNPAEYDYTYSPVEGTVIPYSADFLKVYNNQVNTGELDILIDKEEDKNVFCNYKKPYWELGNWNFSYLRNNISKYANYGDAFNMSRMFGNYFVVEFTFSNGDDLKVEFEELKYNITK